MVEVRFKNLTILVEEGGYTVVAGDPSRGVNTRYVFETYASLQKWLKENLA